MIYRKLQISDGRFEQMFHSGRINTLNADIFLPVASGSPHRYAVLFPVVVSSVLPAFPMGFLGPPECFRIHDEPYCRPAYSMKLSRCQLSPSMFHLVDDIQLHCFGDLHPAVFAFWQLDLELFGFDWHIKENPELPGFLYIRNPARPCLSSH